MQLISHPLQRLAAAYSSPCLHHAPPSLNHLGLLLPLPNLLLLFALSLSHTISSIESTPFTTMRSSMSQAISPPDHHLHLTPFPNQIASLPLICCLECHPIYVLWFILEVGEQLHTFMQHQMGSTHIALNSLLPCPTSRI